MSEKLYRVEVERHDRAVFYVQAADKDAARTDAGTLSDELDADDWEDDDPTVDVREVEKVFDHELDTWVWVGGVAGHEVAASGWKPA